MKTKREHLRLYKAITGEAGEPVIEELMDMYIQPFLYLHQYFDNTIAKLQWIHNGFGIKGTLQATIHMLADWELLGKKDIEILEEIQKIDARSTKTNL